MTKLSVVIPTFNRKPALMECLAAFRAQQCSGEAELLVVDDGSTDGTAEAVAGLERGPVPIKYLRQENRGPAAARNLGIRNAAGGVVLFTGDDMIPAPGMLQAHLDFHLSRPDENIAMLGLVSWHERIAVSPFMHWLENGGPQFGFSRFRQGEAVPVFWTANLSLKKDFLLGHGLFDEDFRHAAGEDVELGLRLKAAGLTVIYAPQAVCGHLHRTGFIDYCSRQEKAGAAEYLMLKKHGVEPAAQLPAWKRCIAAFSPVLKYPVDLADKAGIGLDPRLYDLILGYYSRRGFRRARGRANP